MLAADLFAVGSRTVAGQPLIPLPADLAEPERRGHVVGTVAAGILNGILALASWMLAAVTGRTVSGIVAATVLFNVAVQVLNLLNQTRLFTLAADARSRSIRHS